MRILFFITICLIHSYVFCQFQIKIEKVDCFLEDCELASEYPNAEFGYLHVPENYDKPEDKWIKVAFCLIKSRDPNPKPDPLIVFAGGWGMSSLSGTWGFVQGFPIKNRDVVIYDYRGSGYSTPNLCPDLGQAQWELIEQNLSYEEFGRENTKIFYECLESLKGEQIDYRQYGTETKTRDAVELIELLGYKEVNLYGVSNGTMGIQGFIRAAENSNLHVRSVVSDSNVPMGMLNHADLSTDYKNSLDKILDDCARNADCNKAFPNLKERFYTFIKQAANDPLYYDGESEVYFNNYEINGVVHQLLYNYRNYKDIPLLLENFIKGELGFFDLMWNTFQRRVVPSNGTSLINFTYDWNSMQEKVINSYGSASQINRDFQLPIFWMDFFLNDHSLGFNPRDTIPVLYDGPALVYAGSYDPITPPHLSKIIHKRYSNSHYIEFPRIGHGAVFTPCGVEIYQDFLAQPEQQPNLKCIETLAGQEIPFITSIYPNQKIAKLALAVLQDKNPFWIMATVLPLLISTFLFVKEAIRGLRKRRINKLQLSLSLLILLFLAGLIYYLKTTADLGGLTLLFGLVQQAWWLPWIALVIVFISLIVLARTVLKSNFRFWNLGLNLSAILVMVIIFNYGLLPFLQ